MSLKEKTLLNDDDDLEFLKNLKEEFYIETADSLEKSETLLLDFEETQNELKKLEYKRILHSIKGSAKAVDEDKFASIIHLIEDSLINLAADSSMDMQFKLLDASLNYIRLKKQNDLVESEKQLAEIVVLLGK